jgi:hypothetical protein
MGVLHIILKAGHPKIISTQISEQKILMWFLSHNKNYKRQMVSWNCKHVQHVKIYLPCNFEVNLITHLGVIALFSSFFFFLSSFREEDFFLNSSPLFSNLHNRSKWVMGFTSKLQDDELFKIYYGIFYELWTFADFDRLCKLEKRGDEIWKKSSPLKLLSQSQPNFAEMILVGSLFKLSGLK